MDEILLYNLISQDTFITSPSPESRENLVKKQIEVYFQFRYPNQNRKLSLDISNTKKQHSQNGLLLMIS